MFGLGATEIIVILVVALIVIGPSKLPDFAKTLGKALREFKSATQDFRHNLDMEASAPASKQTYSPVDLKEAIKNGNGGTADKEGDPVVGVGTIGSSEPSSNVKEPKGNAQA